MLKAQSNLLAAATSVLVVVDIQSKLSAVMPPADNSAMLEHVQRLLQAAELLAIPVLLTEQYPKGLGVTDAAIREQLPVSTQKIVKTSFSCCAADDFNQALTTAGRQQVILVGQETHVCVLQTALELLAAGYQVYVVEDAVCSRRIEHKFYALQRMQQQGVTISNHESVLFEWLRNADHPEFKTIAKLLR